MEAITTLIPPSARLVVEFGCGMGQIGQEFKQIQPECHYFGIDIEKENIKQAVKVLDGVSQERDLVTDLSRYGLDQIDCILYHSEYLKNKDIMSKIQQQLSYLANDGQIIFLLDNVQSIHNILQIIKGNIPTVETMWMLKKFLKKISDIGLWVDNISTVSLPDWQELQENKKVHQLCQAFESICQEEKSDTGVFGIQQYAIRTVKKAVKHQLRIIAMPRDPVCETIRIKLPNQFYRTKADVEVIETNSQDLAGALKKLEEKPSILLMQRAIFADEDSAMDVMGFMADDNRVLLHEFDDCPIIWDEFYEKTNYLEFRACHGIQTSTSALGDYFMQYNPNVLVFQNHLEYLPPERHSNLQDKKVTIFYGALNRVADWQEIMPVLNEVIEKYGDRLFFKVTADRQFYESLHTNQKEYVGEEYNEGNFAPYDLYKEALYTSDIALLPLKDNLFNRMKSDLKFIEAAAHGAVVLASPTVYKDTVRDGRTGFIYNSPREFKEWLMLLIENPILRLETAQMAYRYVKENRLLAQHYEERIQAYQELIVRLPKLERERQERIAKWK